MGQVALSSVSSTRGLQAVNSSLPLTRFHALPIHFRFIHSLIHPHSTKTPLVSVFNGICLLRISLGQALHYTCTQLNSRDAVFPFQFMLGDTRKQQLQKRSSRLKAAPRAPSS